MERDVLSLPTAAALQLLRKVHFPQKGRKAGIVCEVLHKGIDLKPLQPDERNISFTVSPFKPRKRLVQLPAIGVDESNCSGLVLVHHLRKRRIRLSSPSHRVINKSQAAIGLALLHLCQRGIELSLCQEYASQRAMCGFHRGTDLNGFPKLGFRVA